MTLQGKPHCIICQTQKGQEVKFIEERPFAWYIGGFSDETLEETIQLIEEDPRECYINSDSTVGRVAKAMKKHPDKVLDTGFQEINMVTIAAGLAKEGYIPFVQTFDPFLCVRALDQIHNDVCYNNFPVSFNWNSCWIIFWIWSYS